MTETNLTAFLRKFNGLVPLSVLVFLLSFYPYNPSIETGLDPSYAFGLNYIFAHNIPFGIQVIYTYGPFGFLTFPQDIGNNFILGIVLTSVLRFAFIFLILYLGRIVNKKLWFLHALLAFLLCNWFYLDFVLVGATTSCILVHQKKQIKSALITASIITVLALLIKSSFGLMCASILISYGIYDALINRRSEIISVLFVTGVFSFLLLWLLLYGNVEGVYSYFVGFWQLSVGNSSAMIIETENNWWWISCFAISFLSIPFLWRTQEIKLLYIVSFFSLFAAWKYAFSREENYHLKFFFDYLLLFVSLVIVIMPSFKPRILAMLLCSLLFYHQSMKASKMYTLEEEVRFDGINNFMRTTFLMPQQLEDAAIRSQQNLKSKVLPDTLIHLIGGGSIDFFPWELTYAAANKLNWIPRPNLQSGAYTPWLDRNNANFISSKKSAEFMLWHLDKPKGGVDCFDERYLLNDEPFTIFSIFNRYKLVYTDSLYYLFQKGSKINFPMIVEGSKVESNWNTWISVPNDTNGILRIKLELAPNTFGKMRKMLYKDMLYFMDYKLEDGSIKTHRVVAENAINGLWVSPYLERLNAGLKGKKVVEVRFKSSKKELATSPLRIQWQIITLAKNQLD